MYFGFTKPDRNSNKSKKYRTEFYINNTQLIISEVCRFLLFSEGHVQYLWDFTTGSLFSVLFCFEEAAGPFTVFIL